MLYVYFGTDRQKIRDAASELTEAKKSPEGTVTIIEAGGYQTGQLADALGATSLFGGEEWYMIDLPADNSDLAEEVSENLAAMAESVNIFIVLEGSLLASAKKKYEKHAAVIEEYTASKTERFNTFAMADALASKDRRRLWVLLQGAKSEGMAAEEIIGMLWWQVKSLRLAELTPNAAAAGMKDFPYNKAKRSLVQFSPNEVSRLSHTLVTLYHDGHAGIRDIDLALERWVLSGK